jgi:hypothetical protein
MLSVSSEGCGTPFMPLKRPTWKGLHDPGPKHVKRAVSFGPFSTYYQQRLLQVCPSGAPPSLQPLSAVHTQWQPMLDASPELVKALQKVTTIAQATLLLPGEVVGCKFACVRITCAELASCQAGHLCFVTVCYASW